MRHRLWLFLILSLSIYSAAKCHTLNDSVEIHFRQSKTNIDTAYMHNNDAFRHIRSSILNNSRNDSDLVLTGVKVLGGASPEGSVRFNEWLSEQRAKRIYDYLRQYISLPDSLTTEILLGRDWEGLRSRVVNDPNVPSRDEVVAVLDLIIEKYRRGEKESDGNLSRLKSVAGGVPYSYMYRNLFPSLRESKVVLTYGMHFSKLPGCDMRLFSPGISPAATDIVLSPSSTKQERNFYMALKTNMLLDILAVPQASIEFYLGKNFSIVGNWMYGWWDNDATHRYWRLYGGDIALRWWFGRKAHEKPLTGHHLGVYGGVFTYDFEFGGKGYMGGLPGHWLWDRFMRNVGVEYGYSLPIARRLNIDFTFGFGYIEGKYIEYVPSGGFYEWQSTKKRKWFGPSKIEVALTWLIGHGNYNKKKGVER